MRLSSRRPGLTLVELLAVLVILIALAGLLAPLLGDVNSDAKITTTRASLQQLAGVITKYRADNADQLPRPGAVGMAAPNSRPNLPQLRYLFVNPGASATDPLAETAESSFNPFARIGWNGPYVTGGYGTYPLPTDKGFSIATPTMTATTAGFTATFGNPSDPCPMDAWNHPIVLVTTADGMIAWLQSAGPNGQLEGLPLTAPTGLMSAPVPSGNGSLFPGSTTPVDDITFVVYQLR
jgi:type II secretory pathway pseudopilin PulG